MGRIIYSSSYVSRQSSYYLLHYSHDKVFFSLKQNVLSRPWFLWSLGVHENFRAPYRLGDA
jgi:hypothetical protein